jgi:ABC-type enterobactin transport system permease subunit
MTILVRIGVGHVVSGSMGVGPHGQTVAGVGAVEAVRERVGVLARRVPRWLAAVRAGALG